MTMLLWTVITHSEGPYSSSEVFQRYWLNLSILLIIWHQLSSREYSEILLSHALWAWHFLIDLYPDFDHNRNHPLVLSTIRGSKKVQADPVVHKLPLRLSHLSTITQHSFTTSSYNNLLFATIMSCAFYGCHHMGELIVKSDKSLFNWRKIIKRSSLTFSNNRAQYRLPYHKADPFFHGSDVIFSQHEVANPIDLLKAYTLRHDTCHGARLPLFLREDGSIPNHAWFDAKLFSFISHDYGGHSLHAGNVTYYASLGLSNSIIQALGRWSSSACKIYIRDNPSIRAEQQLTSIRLHHLHNWFLLLTSSFSPPPSPSLITLYIFFL